MTGRFRDQYELGPIKGAAGFDGQTIWSQDESGQSRVEEGGESREAGANDAYRRSLAYFFPERWEAHVEYAGLREEGDRRFHVVRLTPKGGRPFDLWIDASTFLIDRTVEKAAIETRTVFFRDYREVEGVQVPFGARSTTAKRSTTRSRRSRRSNTTRRSTPRASPCPPRRRPTSPSQAAGPRRPSPSSC